MEPWPGAPYMVVAIAGGTNDRLLRALCFFMLRKLSVVYQVSQHKRHFQKQVMVKVLNVAEKNDAAKNIADHLSRGRFRRREGLSKYNKIYEFDYMFMGQQCTMVMTSVSGHLLEVDFIGGYKKWEACNPVSLFEAPVISSCTQQYEPIKKTLERESRGCNTLIIWTDCDREGENIGFQVIQVCKNVKSNIRIFRAVFSEITHQAVTRAVQNLGVPDKKVSDAVDVRRELDLRIGAAFTRFQTMRFRRVFPQLLADSLISYGSCQFPTLGFVVERYKQSRDFISEPFWKLRALHKVDEDEVIFIWKRGRLFDKTSCLCLYDICLENPLATVLNVTSKPKSKWRPLPLDTVELEKLASRKLRINAKEAMRIAEKLYTDGFISYPRTETNIFPDGLDLRPLVEMQTPDPQWGEFASRVLHDGPNPRKGKKSDQAHPPIHPTKYTDSLQGNDKKLYEFIVRHFLACVSKDAEGYETVVEIDIAKERFQATGLMITARNYLEVYPYDKWSDKSIPIFNIGDTFTPKIEMNESETTPPPLLTEADLIALMEKHGIGTDATHAEHIEKIKARLYIGLQGDGRFVPGQLGMGLVEGYDAMGFEMSKPHLRAELEADLKRICEGSKDPKVVLQEQVAKYREVFVKTMEQVNKLDESLSHYLEQQAEEYQAPAIVEEVPKIVMKCNKCNSDMNLKKVQDGSKFYIGCMAFPACRNALWLPTGVSDVQLTDTNCDLCHPTPVLKLNFTFKPGSMPLIYPRNYTGCVGGCDPDFLEALGLPVPVVRQVPDTSEDSGYGRSRNSLGSVGSTGSSPPQPWTSNQTNPTLKRPRLTTFLPNGSENDNILCLCEVPAILLTVRKEGINNGRQFYKCAGSNGKSCNFFLWAPSSGEPNNNTTTSERNFLTSPATRDFENRPIAWSTPVYTPASRQQSIPLRSAIPLDNSFRNNSENINPENVMCQCNKPAVLLTVRKEGPNTGRKFYSCDKMRNDTPCSFFLWAPDDVATEAGHSNSISAPRNPWQFDKGKSGAKKPQPGTTQKRKCSICREVGHTKKNCPSK